MLKIAVFVSGRGSNLKAILEHFPKGGNLLEVTAIVSNKKDCPAMEMADKYSIPKFFVREKSKEGFTTFSELTEIFIDMGVELVVLAGFLKKIPSAFIDKFSNRIINIHPALLPSVYGGNGMYGMNVHNAVYENGEKISGPTVHFVDEIYDNGKVIAKREVDITGAKSPGDVASMVLKKEHELLPWVVQKFAENKIKIENEIVSIED